MVGGEDPGPAHQTDFSGLPNIAVALIWHQLSWVDRLSLSCACSQFCAFLHHVITEDAAGSDAVGHHPAPAGGRVGPQHTALRRQHQHYRHQHAQTSSLASGTWRSHLQAAAPRPLAPDPPAAAASASLLAPPPQPQVSPRPTSPDTSLQTAAAAAAARGSDVVAGGAQLGDVPQTTATSAAAAAAVAAGPGTAPSSTGRTPTVTPGAASETIAPAQTRHQPQPPFSLPIRNPAAPAPGKAGRPIPRGAAVAGGSIRPRAGTGVEYGGLFRPPASAVQAAHVMASDGRMTLLADGEACALAAHHPPREGVGERGAPSAELDSGLGQVPGPALRCLQQLPHLTWAWLAPETPATAHLLPATWPQPAVYRPPWLPPPRPPPPEPHRPPPHDLCSSSGGEEREVPPADGGGCGDVTDPAAGAAGRQRFKAHDADSAGRAGASSAGSSGRGVGGGGRCCGWCATALDGAGLCEWGCGGQVAVLPGHPASAACSTAAVSLLASWLGTGAAPLPPPGAPDPGLAAAAGQPASSAASCPAPPPQHAARQGEADDDAGLGRTGKGALRLTYLDCSFHGPEEGLSQRLLRLAAGPVADPPGGQVAASRRPRPPPAEAAGTAGTAAWPPGRAGRQGDDDDDGAGGPDVVDGVSVVGTVLRTEHGRHLRHLVAVRSEVGCRELRMLGRGDCCRRLVTLDLSGCLDTRPEAAASAVGPPGRQPPSGGPPRHSGTAAVGCSGPWELGRELREAVARLVTLKVLRLGDCDLRGFFSPAALPHPKPLTGSAASRVHCRPAGPRHRPPPPSASCAGGKGRGRAAATAADTPDGHDGGTSGVASVTTFPCGGGGGGGGGGVAGPSGVESSSSLLLGPMVHTLSPLRHLELSGSVGLGPLELSELLRVATQLTHLGVAGCRGLAETRPRGDSGGRIDTPAAVATATAGSAAGCRASSGGGGGDGTVPCRRLRSLSVGWGFNAAAVRRLCSAGGSCVTSLELDVGACVTDAGLAAVAAACPHLRELRLALCAVSGAAVGAVLATCGKLHVLHVVGCVGPFGRRAMLGPLGWLLPPRGKAAQSSRPAAAAAAGAAVSAVNAAGADCRCDPRPGDGDGDGGSAVGGRRGGDGSGDPGTSSIATRWAMSDLRLVGGPFELYDEDILSILSGRPVYGCTVGDCAAVGADYFPGAGGPSQGGDAEYGRSGCSPGGVGTAADSPGTVGHTGVSGSGTGPGSGVGAWAHRLRRLHTLSLVGLPWLSDALLVPLRDHATDLRHIRLERCGHGRLDGRPLPSDASGGGGGGRRPGPGGPAEGCRAPSSASGGVGGDGEASGEDGAGDCDGGSDGDCGAGRGVEAVPDGLQPFSSEALLGWVQRCTRLTNLRLRHCCQFDSDVVSRLAASCPSLEALMLDACDLPPDGFAASPSPYGALSYVMVARCRGDAAGLAAGPGLSGCGAHGDGATRPTGGVWWLPVERDVKVVRFSDGAVTKLPMF